MSHIFSKKSSVKLPPRSREEKNEEWGRETGNIIFCPRCGNLHYGKKWHHAGDIPKKNFEKAKVVRKICPACKMVRDHAFEGELFIEDVPEKFAQELLNLTKAFGERATEMNSQSRVISINKKEDTYRIITTENQLSVKLAKKVKNVFKNVELNISHAKEPSKVSRVRAIFLVRKAKN